MQSGVCAVLREEPTGSDDETWFCGIDLFMRTFQEKGGVAGMRSLSVVFLKYEM